MYAIYKVSKDVLLFGVYSTFKLSKYSSLILKHAFDYWLAENILNFLGKVVRPNQTSWIGSATLVEIINKVDQFKCPTLRVKFHIKSLNNPHISLY